MFKGPLQYFGYVFKKAALETVKWNGPTVIGLLAGLGLTAIEMKEGQMTAGHLVRDYGLVIVFIYLCQLGRSFWLAHQELKLCAEDMWKLKQDLREVACKFPGNAFVKRPTDRMNWSPLIGEPETGLAGNELVLAIDWHNRFKQVFGANCASMSWDETFAFLDSKERERRGLPV